MGKFNFYMNIVIISVQTVIENMTYGYFFYFLVIKQFKYTHIILLKNGFFEFSKKINNEIVWWNFDFTYSKINYSNFVCSKNDQITASTFKSNNKQNPYYIFHCNYFLTFEIFFSFSLYTTVLPNWFSIVMQKSK